MDLILPCDSGGGGREAEGLGPLYQQTPPQPRCAQQLPRGTGEQINTNVRFHQSKTIYLTANSDEAQCPKGSAHWGIASKQTISTSTHIHK
ncbi:MAG: hypothetical protein RL186_1654 [Pseudomonadota bacterium]